MRAAVEMAAGRFLAAAIEHWFIIAVHPFSGTRRQGAEFPLAVPIVRDPRGPRQRSAAIFAGRPLFPIA
jgi:hypothetical protein